MPAEPMAPVFTLGGVVSTSSHGSGRKFPPLSNQVIELEYVDEKGEVLHIIMQLSMQLRNLYLLDPSCE